MAPAAEPRPSRAILGDSTSSEGSGGRGVLDSIHMNDPEDARTRVPKKRYEKELLRLQEELVKMEEWVQTVGARVVVIFEGRDAAGKGGTIKRITQYLNPRATRIVALPKPNDRQRTQWYFQRYIEELP